MEPNLIKCFNCDGLGYTRKFLGCGCCSDEEFCEHCNGTGEIDEQEHI